MKNISTIILFLSALHCSGQGNIPGGVQINIGSVTSGVDSVTYANDSAYIWAGGTPYFSGITDPSGGLYGGSSDIPPSTVANVLEDVIFLYEDTLVRYALSVEDDGIFLDALLKPDSISYQEYIGPYYSGKVSGMGNFTSRFDHYPDHIDISSSHFGLASSIRLDSAGIGLDCGTGDLISFYGKYGFPDSQPSTTAGDSSTIVWVGNGTGTVPAVVPFSTSTGGGGATGSADTLFLSFQPVGGQDTIYAQTLTRQFKLISSKYSDYRIKHFSVGLNDPGFGGDLEVRLAKFSADRISLTVHGSTTIAPGTVYGEDDIDIAIGTGETLYAFIASDNQTVKCKGLEMEVMLVRP